MGKGLSSFAAADDHWKNQPRDEKGQWSETGASGAGLKTMARDPRNGLPRSAPAPSKVSAPSPAPALHKGSQGDQDIDALFGVEQDPHTSAKSEHDAAQAHLEEMTKAFNAAREARRANSKDAGAVAAYNEAAKRMNAATQAVQAAKSKLESFAPKAPLEQHPDMLAHFGDKTPTQEQLNANYGLKGDRFANEVTVKPGEYGVQFDGKITDKATGEPVVYQFARTVTRDSDGTLAVKHEHLATNPAFPSAGREILHNTTKEHYAMGVRRIDVSPEGGGHGLGFEEWTAKQAEYKAARQSFAAVEAQHKSGQMDQATYQKHFDEWKARVSEGGDLHSGYIGPYVWASSGFKWGANDAEKMGAQFASYLQSEHGVPAAQATALAESVKHDPKAMLVSKVGGKPVGAHFLQQRVKHTDEPWSLPMKKGDPGWEHYKTTYGLHGIDDDQGQSDADIDALFG